MLSLFNYIQPKKCLALVFSAALLLNCTGNTEDNNTTYFGGQIINPKSDKVYISKGDHLLDSAKLNAQNKFLIELDSLTLGLYVFRHGPEIQYIYLEPKDSLLIRINTWDFDESLVFSGKGAERNNFLINLFLENEKEDKQFFEYYHLNDSLFELKVDSVLQRKKLLYTQFKEEIPENSLLFEKLVHSAMYYPLFRKKEAYPYRNKKALKSKEYAHVHPRFYKFRKEIDINDDDLVHFYPHNDYVRTYLYHLAYEKQVLDTFKSTMQVNFMKVALENIKEDNVKNKYLHEGMWMTLLDENAAAQEKDDAQRLFFDHCSDQKSVSEISDLISASEKLPKGHKLPDMDLYSFNDDTTKLSSIIENKNVIIYTWPTNQLQIDNLSKRVAYLEKKYPDFLFVGVNSKNSEYNWKKHVKAKKINRNNQYRIGNSNDLLDVNFSMAIIVDKNGIVQNNMTHLSISRFEKQLKKLKN